MLKGLLISLACLVAIVVAWKILQTIIAFVEPDPALSGDVMGSFHHHRIRMSWLSSEGQANYIRRLMDRADRVANTTKRRTIYVVCTDLVSGLGGPIYGEVQERFDRADAAEKADLRRSQKV